MPSIVGTTALALIGYIVYKTYNHRARINRLRKAGYPMPPWNWVFGHLLVLKKYTDRHPADTFITTPIRDMARDFPESDMFYLDLWPFTATVLAVCDADTANQATTKNPFPKADSFNVVFEPIMGGPNLLSMNDQEWKEWRALMNPGFGSGYIQDLLPAIMDNVDVFIDKLRERVGTVFCIEELVTRMTMDIIVKVTLDDDMNYQNGPNPLADSLRAMISWTSFGNFFIRHNPTRPMIMKYYGGIMNRYIQGAMTKRWAEYKAEKAQGASKRSKSAISLALEGYMKKLDSKGIEGAELDAHFAAYAQYQIRLFLFAGHDTTTGSMVYSLHMLAKHPEVLRKVQEEHTSVFGPDPAEAGSRLRENPALVNQLPYTLAVIKETMRMYAPSGAVRDGVPGRSIVDRHGKQFPTEGIHISIMHSAIHDNPRIWPRVREFVPERWLVEPGHELHPPHGAWRAFEVGPRNCIGQTLAIMELRLTLVMVARTFSIKPAYEEWDKMKPKGMLEKMGLVKEGMNTVDGDRAYPIERGGGHPKDQYPCRVTLL